MLFVQFLMPRMNIKGEFKMKDFTSMEVCVKWLGEIAHKMTWDEHMHVAAEEMTGTYRKKCVGRTMRIQCSSWDRPDVFFQPTILFPIIKIMCRSIIVTLT